MERDKTKPLFSLTVGEYIDLTKSIYNAHCTTKPKKLATTPKSDIIYLEETIKLTGYTAKTLYTKVSRGEIPVVSSGRPLTFSRKQLIKWIKDGRPSVSEIKAMKFLSAKK